MTSRYAPAAYDAGQFFATAALLTPRGRWEAAVQFFGLFSDSIGRETVATLASDWASFGFETRSLAEYVEREFRIRADFRAEAEIAVEREQAGLGARDGLTYGR
jgi:hypothetical protein